MSGNKKKSKLSHMGNDVYEVEQILNHRFINQRSEYLVKWAGYSNAHNSWEPEANIYDKSLIADYEEQFVKRYREKSSSSDNDDYEVDDRDHCDKSKKSKLIKTKKYPSYREDIKHSSKISKKRIRMLENSLDEERREFPSTSSTGRSSIKSHKDKDHHRKHKHRSEHDKHHLKSSKLLKVSSESSSIVNKRKKNKHKKRKHHEHGDIPADSNVEQVQRDGQPAKMNFQRKTFKEFFESVKGKPKMCTPVTCNGTTFIITEYI